MTSGTTCPISSSIAHSSTNHILTFLPCTRAATFSLGISSPGWSVISSSITATPSRYPGCLSKHCSLPRILLWGHSHSSPLSSLEETISFCLPHWLTAHGSLTVLQWPFLSGVHSIHLELPLCYDLLISGWIPPPSLRISEPGSQSSHLWLPSSPFKTPTLVLMTVSMPWSQNLYFHGRKSFLS